MRVYDYGDNAEELGPSAHVAAAETVSMAHIPLFRDRRIEEGVEETKGELPGALQESKDDFVADIVNTGGTSSVDRGSGMELTNMSSTSQASQPAPHATNAAAINSGAGSASDTQAAPIYQPMPW
eukprot:CAMPEP_0182583504 /NCGR_PEP_ID=MMETSP1324-20130603/55357_1 /TAXON_ID=236786 /ORGANISM="Florenciella sp., Strain RCC1587" /LENGTH=124 /DNA_ID=CAMNT_0024800077 /DNA_START=20 /DNA_END=391 /DNA_ORIENTATION=-